MALLPLLVSAALAMVHLRGPVPAVLTVGASQVIPLIAARSVLNRGPAGITAADRVTLFRAGLAGVLSSALVLVLLGAIPTRSWWVAVIAAVAALLDAADGWIARRLNTSTAAGARLDEETDAAALLVLSGLFAVSAGWWVLLIGLMRYAFVAAASVRQRWRAPLPYSRVRKVVAAAQAAALVIALVPAIPLPAATGLAAGALSALALSFGRDILHLERSGRASSP